MAVTLVTCRICKEKIDKDIAFKIGERRYCCSEEEYLHNLEEKEKELLEAQETKRKSNEIKDETFNIICELFERKITNSILFKELKELDETYTYENVYLYIHDNFDFLNRTINGKKFSSEYAKIRYFFAIIKNNIVDYLEIKKDEIEEQEYIKNIEYDIPEIRYKSKNKRRALYDIEMELITDDE